MRGPRALLLIAERGKNVSGCIARRQYAVLLLLRPHLSILKCTQHWCCDSLSRRADETLSNLKISQKLIPRQNELADEGKIEELVKVAVIDTGIDLHHPGSGRCWRGQLDSGVDFVDEGRQITDTDGHGTHVCHTLLKTAPYAKLYPMRVFRAGKRKMQRPRS